MEQLYIQQKFLSYISPFLERFKQKRSLLWNFRCPYCGDSEKSPIKARGYIYQNKQGLLQFQCHNCGENHTFRNFLRFIDQRLYKEYILETIKNEKGLEQKKEKKLKAKETKITKDWMNFLIPFSKLSKSHIAYEYVKKRKIPEEKYEKIWFTYNFQDFVQKLGLEQKVPNDSRIVLVETDKFNNLKIVVARALKKTNLRYITLKIDTSYPKIFGLSDIDFSKPIYVVEGAIDSLFLDNCIASLDANLLTYKNYNLGINNAIHIWDNEPRNANICSLMYEAIRKNEKVVIFPPEIHQKDINEMVLDGIDVKSLVEKRTFRSIQALLEFSNWKRINVK